MPKGYHAEGPSRRGTVMPRGRHAEGDKPEARLRLYQCGKVEARLDFTILMVAENGRCGILQKLYNSLIYS